MTLIVWDGGRRKKQRLAADLPPSAAPEVAAARAHPLPAEPMSEQVVETASVETSPTAHFPEGSRIGLATHVSGNLVAREPVVVKGRIEGAIIAQDHPVMVTMSGRVSSYLEGHKVSVDGQVAGMVKAGDKITLLSQARVEGSLEARRLECVAGARIRGEVASVEPLGGIPMDAGTKAESGLP
nr:polymer-forming cytoskeletal protein [Halomonas zhangzhouensis]